jgi:hypothetical protein
MPWIVYVIAISILRGVSEAIKRTRKKRPRGLCADCTFVHMQYGVTGRNAVFCTFGGGVREVKLTCSIARITVTGTQCLVWCGLDSRGRFGV